MAKAVEEGVRSEGLDAQRNEVEDVEGAKNIVSSEEPLFQDFNLTGDVSGGDQCVVHKCRPPARSSLRRNAFR